MACVRVCPVEAIEVREGAVEIVPESCIRCGLCVPTCPHDAIHVKGEPARVAELAATGNALLILAAEAPAHFYPATPEQVVNACLAAGFRGVYSSIVGDELVAREYLRLLRQNGKRLMIRSTSPVVVEYCQRKYPQLLPYLAPVATPPVAAARYLRAAYHDSIHVVYAGASSPGNGEEVRQAIDASLTFAELETMLRARGIDPAAQLPYFIRLAPERRRHISAAGGLPLPVLDAERMSSRRFRKIRGLENVAALADVVNRLTEEALGADGGQPAIESLGFIDLMPYDGDVDHPAMGPKEEVYWRRAILRLAEPARSPDPVLDESLGVDLGVDYAPRVEEAPSEEEIVALIDREIGRAPSGRFWDSKACGYSGCREFAAAALRGRASLVMCPMHLNRKYEAALQEAAFDALTGLYSYRVLRQRLAEEFHRARRKKTPLALVFMDIDNFKGVNDYYGHTYGNDALRAVAASLKASIRSADFAARFGGDEMVAILIDAAPAGALQVAHKIRGRVAETKISAPG
ncbi:MAG: diguanylate cyclase, partial [Gemmatimonadetes bacterium]|nr:diguanylate cyclase [Gemmatimonadota bacterium]